MRLQMTIVPSRKGLFRKRLSILMVEYYISTFYLSSKKKQIDLFWNIYYRRNQKLPQGQPKQKPEILNHFFAVPVYCIGMSNAFASMAGMVEKESGRTDCGWWGSVVIAGKIRPLLWAPSLLPYCPWLASAIASAQMMCAALFIYALMPRGREKITSLPDTCF